MRPTLLDRTPGLLIHGYRYLAGLRRSAPAGGVVLGPLGVRQAA